MVTLAPDVLMPSSRPPPRPRHGKSPLHCLGAFVVSQPSSCLTNGQVRLVSCSWWAYKSYLSSFTVDNAQKLGGFSGLDLGGEVYRALSDFSLCGTFGFSYAALSDFPMKHFQKFRAKKVRAHAKKSTSPPLVFGLKFSCVFERYS